MIVIIQVGMQSSQYKQWLKMAPITYSYLSSTELPDYAALTAAKFPKLPKVDTSFKYQSFKLLLAGKSHAGNGVFSLNQIEVPLPSQLADERLKCQVNKKCDLNFENPINCFEELTSTATNDYSSDSFIAINQAKHEEIYVYSLSHLMSLKERSYSVKPRVVLPGKSEARTMKSRRQQLLVGTSNGEICLYDLKANDHSPSVFRYHREGILDISWLSLHDKQEERLFVSASPENYLYIWDKRLNNPAFKIEHKQRQTNCLEFVRNSVFLSGGSDSTIKYWDIRNSSTEFYTFRDQGGPIQKICKVESAEAKNEKLMFASGNMSGEVQLWEMQLEFIHGAHSSQIVSLGYNKECQLFMSVERNTAALSLWKPAYFQ